MRILALLSTVGLVLALAGCAPAKPGARTQTPAAPAVQQLIALDPKELIFRPYQMIPGTWDAKEGSIASPQWNRAWDRNPADPGYSLGASRVTATSRLYLSIADSLADFAETAQGEACVEYASRAIELRGFSRDQIKVSPTDLGTLGADQQAACRAEFTRGPGLETYAQYFVFIHVRNTRVLITTFAQHQNGAEAPQLLQDTQQLAKTEADYLKSLPTVAVSLTPTAPGQQATPARSATP